MEASLIRYLYGKSPNSNPMAELLEAYTTEILRIQVSWDMTLSLGEWLPTFRLHLPTVEGTTIVRNVGNHSPEKQSRAGRTPLR
jgi:hypothetical protein